MIELKKINKSFSERQVVSDVSFIFHPGKCNLVIGESGSGKTTLMKMMVGLLVPDSGEILYEGENFISIDRKSTRLNSSHSQQSRMPSSA